MKMNVRTKCTSRVTSHMYVARTTHIVRTELYRAFLTLTLAAVPNEMVILKLEIVAQNSSNWLDSLFSNWDMLKFASIKNAQKVSCFSQ